ncbi:hypothetical protein [uncultured Ruegeria sp.]|uniref:hypothetical protein n=1 Tax=uncultured Ruegeria sp. TaxID=259304 RepID=UPI002602B19B|nr:hypothetical protein [uncultured Ruegeria sp.]
MSFASEVNNWIVENQALSISIGVPLFTVMAGFLGSYLTSKAKTREVKLLGRIRLSEYRKENFDSLQEEIASLQTAMSVLIRYRTSKVDFDGNPIDVTENDVQTMMRTYESIAAGIRASEEVRKKFAKSFSDLLKRVLQTDFEAIDDGEIYKAFREACHQILRNEWAQMETELKRLK